MSDIKETIQTTAQVKWVDPKTGEEFTITIESKTGKTGETGETYISVGDQPALLLGTDQLGTLVHMACRGMALVEEK